MRVAAVRLAPHPWLSYRRLLSTTVAALGGSRKVVSFPNDTTVILFCHVPIEPTASAAGVRTAHLLDHLKQSPGVTAVHVVASSDSAAHISQQPAAVPHRDTTSQTNHDDDRDSRVVQYHTLPPNRSKDTKDLLTRLSHSQHLLVFFDRFYTEEMYSFHVHNHLPHATTVVDLQDLHSLRNSRHDYIRNHGTGSLSNLPIHVAPDSSNGMLLRELASIHRSDVTLVCSSVEMKLLETTYQVSQDKLCWAPLFVPPNAASMSSPDFAQRYDFVFVGGFRHEPNVDAVHQLVRLWPLIRRQLATTLPARDLPNLHVYGAYAKDHWHRQWRIQALVDTGFVFHGHHPGSVDEILRHRRVMLSPLRFGAGIKGKHVDAWIHGLPVVTTPMGSEGMCHDGRFGGMVATSDEEFVTAACDLYTNADQWSTSVAVGQAVATRLGEWDSVATKLVDVMQTCHDRRSRDYTQSILWHQTLRSTEYFSKYIEAKESKEEVL